MREDGVMLDQPNGDSGSTGPPPDEGTIPLRPTPTADELDRAAGQCRLLAHVEALHAAIGDDAVGMTPAGHIPQRETKAFAELLDVDGDIAGARSPADLPEFFAVLRLAVAAGAVETTDTELRARPEWLEAPLRLRWKRLVNHLFEIGPATVRFGAVPPQPGDFAEIADDGCGRFFVMLWLTDRPVRLDELAELMAAAVALMEDEVVLSTLSVEELSAICADRVRDLVRSLEDAGVVATDERGVVLTEGGAWLVEPWLHEAGFDVLDARRVTSMGPRQLLDAVAERGDSPQRIGAMWAAGQPRDETVEALVEEVLARPEPDRSLVGVELLDHLEDSRAAGALERIARHHPVASVADRAADRLQRRS